MTDVFRGILQFLQKNDGSLFKKSKTTALSTIYSALISYHIIQNIYDNLTTPSLKKGHTHIHTHTHTGVLISP